MADKQDAKAAKLGLGARGAGKRVEPQIDADGRQGAGS